MLSELANPETVGAIAAVLVGLASTYRYYTRTGTFRLRTLPLRAARRLFFALRAAWFTRSRPSELGALDASLKQSVRTFASHGYEPQWPFSFNYRGEDANLRAYYFNPKRNYPHRQVHVRLFEEPDGSVGVDAHAEPSALAHPLAHVRSKHMDDVTGTVAEAFAAQDEGALDPQSVVDRIGARRRV